MGDDIKVVREETGKLGEQMTSLTSNKVVCIGIQTSNNVLMERDSELRNRSQCLNVVYIQK